MPSGHCVKPEPFLKWAGGKRLLLSKMLPLFPHMTTGATYFEVFLGGGAVFFEMLPQHSLLSDSNIELIQTFEAVRDSPERIIGYLSSMHYSKDLFYEVRASKPLDPAERAARFIYLNKTCFNGVYRVNLRGEFNVPFGRHPESIEICDEDQLWAASNALRSAKLVSTDFEISTAQACSGDLVYFDPPYTMAHTNNGFIEYNAKVFSWTDQHRLASVAAALVRKGVNVVISNGDHYSVLNIYRQYQCFEVVRLERRSTIASKSAKRGPTSELLIIGRSERQG